MILYRLMYLTERYNQFVYTFIQFFEVSRKLAPPLVAKIVELAYTWMKGFEKFFPALVLVWFSSIYSFFGLLIFSSSKPSVILSSWSYLAIQSTMMIVFFCNVLNKWSDDLWFVDKNLKAWLELKLIQINKNGV